MTAQAEQRSTDFRDALIRDGFDPYTAAVLDGRVRNVSIDERGGRRTATLRMSMEAYEELGTSMALGGMRILNVLSTMDAVQVELLLPDKFERNGKPCRCGHPVEEHARELEFLLSYAKCCAAKMDGSRCRCRIPETEFLGQWTADPEERSPLAPVPRYDAATGIRLAPDERVVRSRRWPRGEGVVMTPSDFVEVSPAPLPADNMGGVLVPAAAFESVREAFARVGASAADAAAGFGALGKALPPRIEKRVSPPVALPKSGRRRLRFDDDE